jgi:uncharacterized membrane protein
LTGLSALALTLSAYLGWHHLVGGSVIGCDGGSSCNEVLSSRWSTIGGVGGGIPVSGLAAGAYLAMLVASLCIGPATAAPNRRLAWGVMLVLAGSAAGSAVWFTIVQKWVIGAFCPYCMATHITGVLLAILVFWRAARQFDADSTSPAPETPAPQNSIRVLPAPGLGLIGVAMAGIMAACQVVIAPPAGYRAGRTQNNRSALDPRAVPLVGSPDAPYIVTLLFDYKCPHCQRLHSMLDEVIRRYGGRLAFALCPSPLNTRCNPYVPRDVDQFKDACELAEVGLAVWVAKREALPAFNLWMFSFESGDRWRPRSLDAAKAKAVELIGQAKFDAAQTDPWIGRYMRTSIRIYGDTLQGGNAIPKMVFGSRWVTPEPNDADDLVSILHDSLAVPMP